MNCSMYFDFYILIYLLLLFIVLCLSCHDYVLPFWQNKDLHQLECGTSVMLNHCLELDK